jgi:cell division septation protein DedD
MPAGTFTLTADIGGQVFTRTLTVPARPTMIDEVVLGKPPTPRPLQPLVGAAADAPVAARAVSTPALSDAPHLVQAGAFRNARNARELVIRLQRGGETPFTATSRGMTFIYVGPFATAHEAMRASRRLQKSGIEAFVTHREK